MMIYLVRHGQTDLNKKNVMQGVSNTPLNEEGLKQAYNVKEKIKNINFDICFSSPLKRTLDTAKIITDGKCNIVTNNLLIERDLGRFEKMPYDDYKKYDFWNLKENLNYNKVEPVKNVFKRAKKFLKEIKNSDYKTVLVVSHHAIIRALHFNIIGYDDSTSLLSFHPENGKIYKYEI